MSNTLFVWTAVFTALTAVAFEAFLRISSDKLQVRARIVETVFASLVGMLALASLWQASAGLIEFTLGFTFGFFTYHLHRVIFVPGYVRGLIGHHIGMLLLIVSTHYVPQLEFYILIASIPIASAAIRNLRWFYKMSGRPRWYSGAVAAASAYAAIESLPPLFAVLHFFLVGVHRMQLPTYSWIAIIVPGLLLALMTFYWSAQFVQKALARPLGHNPSHPLANPVGALAIN